MCCNSFSDSHSAVTPGLSPPIAASSSQFNVEGVKELSLCVSVCLCVCQCVNMFESASNVRDCAYDCSVYFYRQVSERVKQPTLKQEISPFQPSVLAI